jgi:uncharacterized metal-binding protein YceD (DUF177 family)
VIVDLDRLAEGGETFEGEEPMSVFCLEGEQDLRICGPLRYRVSVSRVQDELLIHGALAAEVAFRCSRCAEIFETEIVDGTESVDLTPDMREAILLAFPAYPVCCVDCKGLCPQCGVNRNTGTCRCKPPADGRWDALERLRL